MMNWLLQLSLWLASMMSLGALALIGAGTAIEFILW